MKSFRLKAAVHSVRSVFPIVPVASCFLLAAVPITEAVAQRSDTVVVTGTRQPVRANELLNEVSVFTREDIERATPTMLLGEFLASQGSILFVNRGPGGEANIHMRGTGNSHTIFLIDGVRMESSTTGQSGIEGISLSQIERIEVLKGPASALYGSDAIGGVIQVFTRRGEGPPRINAEISSGSWNTHAGNVGISGQSGAVRYSLRGGADRSDGYNTRNALAGVNIYNPGTRYGYDRHNFSGQVSVDLAEGHELGLQTFYNHIKYDAPGGTAGSPRYTGRSNRTQESYSAYSRNRITTNWNSLLRMSQSMNNFENDNSPGANTITKTTQDQFVWQNDIKLPIGSLLLAAESLREKIGGTNPYTNTKRTTNSGLAGWMGSIGNHRAQLNMRHDDVSQFGSKTTGGAMYGYQITNEWRVRGGYSTGFNVPSFNDLYNNTSFGIGNPNLKPETSKNKEIGINYDAARTRLSVTAYRNDIDNLIRWIGIGGGMSSPIQIEKARITGVSLTGQHNFGSLTVRASYDALSPKDRSEGYYIARIARQHGMVGFDHRWQRLTWGADVLAMGRRYQLGNPSTLANPGNSQPLEGFATVNLRAEYRINGEVSLFARANNIFNKEYQMVRGFAMPGFHALFGVRYAMR